MIIQINDKTSIDTDRDLNSEERHILQKLLCYVYYVGSIDEFRQKKETAYRVGWNDSGPVRQSVAMARVIERLEADILLRLQNQSHP